jgi:predicted transcriptional regulator
MGGLEAAVMEVLWDRGGWSTPGEVREALSGERSLAYTTVMTIMTRLWRKGRLERERDGRAYAYRPVHGREEHAAARMGELLSGARDRTMVLSRFVKELDEADRVQLRRMLRGRMGEQAG